MTIDGDVVRVPASNQTALVDLVDLGIVEGVCWFTDHYGYVVRSRQRRPDGSWTQDRLHRIVVDAPFGVEVDHKNGDQLDCRRSNLRLATRTEQVRNRRKRRDSSSPFKGVRRNGKNGWMARIVADRKDHYLGTFRTPVEAALAYDAAAVRLHGEFAATNASLGLLDEAMLSGIQVAAALVLDSA